MEDEGKKNDMLCKLLDKKRKLLRLKNEIQSSAKRLKTREEEKDECRSFENQPLSISPPPFSPLTPLAKKQDNNKHYTKSTSDIVNVLRSTTDSETEFVGSHAPPNQLQNIDNNTPLSSPVPSMSPDTQNFFNNLYEEGSDIIEDTYISEEEYLNFFNDASDDSVKDPDFVAEENQHDNSENEHDSTNNDVSNDKNGGISTITEKDNTPILIIDKEVITESRSEEEINTVVSTASSLTVEENINQISENLGHYSQKSNNSERDTIQAVNKKCRSRKQRQESKILRNSGKSYITEKGKVVPERKSRELNSCRSKCGERITEAVRNQCFEDYWKLGNRDRRAAYIAKSISIFPKKSEKTDSKSVNRNVYCVYNLLISNSETPTCKECFCRILGETKGFINIIINKKKLSPTGIIDTDKRGLTPCKNKKTVEDVSCAINHISSFPAYESHYCRKSTGKKYLPSDLSIIQMYRDYKKTTEKPISLKLYSKCFHDLNLSFKKASKDTCNTCDVLNTKIKISAGDLKLKLIAELNEHHTLAEKAYNEKRKDKEMAINDPSIQAFAFDLQQCLPTPYLKTSVSFYKRQLWSFNLTIHNLANNEATCYMWDETIGARGANQIASCLWHFCHRLPSEVKEVIFYSDTCGGQNKNNIVAMMFMYLLQTHATLQTINHKFLISGHTHMECDSDHAIIERKKKVTQMKINHLNDWVQLVRSCKVEKPFKVVIMTLNDFLDFSALKSKHGPLSLKKQDETGERFLWQPIKWLQYQKNYNYRMKFKDNLNRETQFKTVNFRKRGKCRMESFQLKKISEVPLPISAEKKRDLMDLLDLIDVHFHEFYLRITTNDSDPIDPDLNEDDPDLEETDL